MPLPLTSCHVQSSEVHQGQPEPGGKRSRPQPAHFFTTSRCSPSSLEVAAKFAVVVGDHQEHSTVFDLRHGAYLRRMRALPVTGLAHPRFMEISASRTWRQPPSA